MRIRLCESPHVEDRGLAGSVSSTSAKTPFLLMPPVSRTLGAPRGCAKMASVLKAKLANTTVGRSTSDINEFFHYDIFI